MNEKVVQDKDLTFLLRDVSAADACVIWLHGLGADGSDFVDVIPSLGLDLHHKIRFIFPHAPPMPVTINGGLVMPAWYDILGLDERASHDEVGLQRSQKSMQKLIQQIMESGIPSHRIILLGFSQGGAVALYTALRCQYRLGGVGSLSGYLPLSEKLPQEKSDINASIPIFIAHGTFDPVVPFAWSQQSYAKLTHMDYRVTQHQYPIQHSVCLPELADLGQWFKECLNEKQKIII